MPVGVGALGEATRGLAGSQLHDVLTLPEDAELAGEADGASEKVIQNAEQLRARTARLTITHGGVGGLHDGGEEPPTRLLLLTRLVGQTLLTHLHHPVQALVPATPPGRSNAIRTLATASSTDRPYA
ncbi:hypothetical protein [Streptomyces sp. Rer75]|uniref:hypothetical protein n=1 Tax=Streptomyces sp. Rer75 TaxID=2750011 RepID=UPI0015D094B3|nr:hypothetical protein [Streptomyces sp. Rer75]QLH19382.1 hypothetical protein HYQ63_00675 [Streptomyces sp. Rer75]QLH26683.1 hypothetical protein HYQ63_43855 [Streptomyces sp. Rer75]